MQYSQNQFISCICWKSSFASHGGRLCRCVTTVSRRSPETDQLKASRQRGEGLNAIGQYIRGLAVHMHVTAASSHSVCNRNKRAEVRIC